MVATRTKISWSLVIVLAGAATALVFRQPAPPAVTNAPHAAASPSPTAEQHAEACPGHASDCPAPERTRHHSHASGGDGQAGPAATPGRGHLLGRIELSSEPAGQETVHPTPADASPAPSPARATDSTAAPSARLLPPTLESTGLGDATPHDELRIVRHRIRDGDTLTFLALRYLGSARRYLEIYEANHTLLPSPDLLPLDVVLQIAIEPEPALASTSLATEEAPLVPVLPGPRGRRLRAVAAGLASRTEPAHSYRMRHGESLTDVAQRLLGDASLSELLFQMNRDRLRNPDDVQEGVLLVLPASDATAPN